MAERAALLRVPFAMLAQLLQLPPSARIDAAMVDLSEDSVLTLRVRDAGWMTHEGHKIPLAAAIVTDYRDDEGRCFKRVVDWQMPGIP